MHPAERVAQIPARVCVDRIEQRAAIGGFRLGGGARLDDRDVILADVFCRTHRSAKILGADAPIHACHVVGAGQYVGERSEQPGSNLIVTPKENIAPAVKLMLAASPEDLRRQDTDEWWRERRALARKLIDLSDAATAYQVASAAAPPINPYYRADVHFMSGWIALRLEKPVAMSDSESDQRA